MPEDPSTSPYCRSACFNFLRVQIGASLCGTDGVLLYGNNYIGSIKRRFLSSDSSVYFSIDAINIGSLFVRFSHNTIAQFFVLLNHLFSSTSLSSSKTLQPKRQGNFHSVVHYHQSSALVVAVKSVARRSLEVMMWRDIVLSR
jgi:hypothetical protein